MERNTCGNCFLPLPGAGPCPYCGYDAASDAGKYPLALMVGAILNGRYILGRVLGQGGFGITYVAQDVQSGGKVAIKEYFPEILATRTQGHWVTAFTGQRQEDFLYGMQCFLSEAQTLAQFIGMEHIVRVHSYFEENGTAYFVMDHVDGISLQVYLKQRGGRIGWEEAERILFPVMEALSVVHSKGIIHRDIAPDNIYITREGNVKLLDFGAARYSLGDKSRSLDVVLKAGYAPMEQYTRRGRQGPYTDVYAMAATFYFAITGHLPPESVERIEEDLLVMPSRYGVRLPVEVEDALEKAMSIRSMDRYQTMEAFHAALAVREEMPVAEPILEPVPEPVKAVPEVAPEVQKPSKKQKKPLWAAALRGVEALEKVLSSQLEDSEEPQEEAAMVQEEEPAQRVVPEPVTEMPEEILEAEPEVIPEAEPEIILEAEPEEIPEAELEEISEDEPEMIPEAEPEEEAIEETAAEEPQEAVVEEQPELPRKGKKGKWIAAAALAAVTVGALAAFLWKPAPVQTETETRPQVSAALPGEDIPKPQQTLLLTVPQKTIATSEKHTIAVAEDGTVVKVGKNFIPNIETWKNVESVAVAECLGGSRVNSHTVVAGVTADGRVLLADSNSHSKWDLSDWTDVKTISMNQQTVAALKTDGTVITQGSNQHGQAQVSHWRNIVDIAIGDGTTLGLGQDGTVYAAGLHAEEAGQWKNMVAICAFEEQLAAVRADGSVVYIGTQMPELDTWTDIVSIKLGQGHVVGLKSDGTVVAAGNNDAGQLDVKQWSDIVAIAAGFHHTVGLKSDGTLVATGGSQGFGQCNVSTVTGVLVPEKAATDTISAVETQPEVTDPWKDLWGGKIVTLGSYEQDNDESNGQEPVEWMVLKKEDDKVFLVSKYVLDFEKRGTGAWSTCHIRKWLNGTFLDSAFTEEEQKRILDTKVTTQGAFGGKDTVDKVFLLSVEERREFSTLGASFTAYAEGQYALEESGSNQYWWLRSYVGYRPGYASINTTHSVGESSSNLNGEKPLGVRPAMWVSIPEEETASEVTEPQVEVPSSLLMGNIVTMGTYEQDNDPSNGQEPIEWIVLEAQEDKVFLVSQFLLDRQTRGLTTWDKSPLRTWLNRDFLKAAFTEEEQEKILLTTVTTADNAQSGNSGGKDTEDKLFLLSTEEFKQYSGITYRGETAYTRAKRNAAGQMNYVVWWLRSPGVEKEWPAHVVEGGFVQQSRGSYHGSSACGVRPAMWVKLEG